MINIWEETDFCDVIIFVTHNVSEAIFMSDRIFIMSNRPGTIKKVVNIPLKRPRTMKIEQSKEYTRINRVIQEEISKESLKMLEGSVAEIIKKVYS